MAFITFSTASLIGALYWGTSVVQGPNAQPRVVDCDTNSFLRGGGMINNGWDGAGQNATTLYFHFENYSPDISVESQRNAVFDALSSWASIVQIHFIEIASPNRARSIDILFARLDHCAIESDECGDPDCPFDGPFGTFAHASFPPGGSSTCGPVSMEHRAGNVHFDEDEDWEQDDFFATDLSMTLIAAHEIGHALGLVHDEDINSGPHIMRPSFNTTDGMQNPSASDAAHLRSGYAAGVGSVTTIEDSGLWVNSAWVGFESGIPGEPFMSVERAIEAIPPSSYFLFIEPPTIHVQAGIYQETLTVSRPCVITSENGTAFIGEQ
jgi:hypothetical protein